MSKPLDITGQRFGQLTAIRRMGSRNGKSLWEFQCDCGNRVVCGSGDVRAGKTKSCGCLRQQTAQAQGYKNAKHSQTHSRLYREWSSMKRRCVPSNTSACANYAERGISVCSEWANSFETFAEWALSHGYNDTLTLDREDVNGNYCPSNCRWVTMKVQQNNRRNNRLLTYAGATMTQSQLADLLCISSATLGWRINAGWTEEDLSLPVAFNNSKIRRNQQHVSQ